MNRLLIITFFVSIFLSGCVSNDSRGQRAIEDANIIELESGLYKGTHSNFISNKVALRTAEMMAIKHCKNMDAESQIISNFLRISKYPRTDVVHITWACLTKDYKDRIAREKAKAEEEKRIAEEEAEESERIAKEKAKAEEKRIAEEKAEADLIEAEIWNVESKLISKNGVYGYKDLKFGLNLKETDDILNSNCAEVEHESTNSNTGYKWIIGSFCFDVSGREIAKLSVEFSDYRISSISIDFNGNMIFTNKELNLLGFIALSGMLDQGKFDSSVLQNILSAVSSKYDLYSTTTVDGWDGYAFEEGALTVEISNEFNEYFEKYRDYMRIKYISNDQEIKSNLNELGLSHINEDEF
jgi:hypothetical protein